MDTHLYQNDPRWKNQKIGLQNNFTIEQVGCMLTSFAMTVNHFGANETPASLNEKMKAIQGFNSAWIIERLLMPKKLIVGRWPCSQPRLN
jgi:hypothetical protein